MQPNVPQYENNRHEYEKKPHMPVQQQMPVNTIAHQDMQKPERPKKRKNRFLRFVRGYLMTVGAVATFAALVYALIVLLETFFPLS